MSIESKIAEILEEAQLDLEDEIFEERFDEDFITEEEYDSLDKEEQALFELSKATLGSYIKKAGQSRKDQGIKTGEFLTGLSHPEINKTQGQADYRSKQGDKAYDTDRHREKGINRAVNKLTKKSSRYFGEEFDVQEDVDALLFGENLSEEFRTKATTIFEAAVISRVRDEVAQLEEEFEEKLAEQVDSITEGLVEKIDGYLDYVVEQWIEQNEIALESGIKSDIMESFISGMKGLFEEHYIDVPEEKYDVLGEMEAKIDALEEKLDEQVSKNIDLKKSLSEAIRKDIVKMVSEGLTATETEKFVDLVEELSYEDEETFQTKVQTIRENYFTGVPSTRKVQSVVTDSPVEELTEESKQVIDPTMAVYLDAIKKYNQ